MSSELEYEQEIKVLKDRVNQLEAELNRVQASSSSQQDQGFWLFSRRFITGFLVVLCSMILVSIVIGVIQFIAA